MHRLLDPSQPLRATLLDRERKVLRDIAQGLPLSVVLDALLRAVEADASTGMMSSILFLSEDGQHLLHGAAPSLPEAYNEAIHGIEIGEGVGSCGTAVARVEPVYVCDISTDPLWDAFRALALSHNLRACWSTPVVAADGHVLGTFAIYYDQPRAPTEADIDAISFISQTAALAIERFRSDADLRRSHDELKRLNAEIEQRAEIQRDRFEQAPGFICILEGPDHVFNFVNAGHRALFNSGEWTGKSVREAFPDIAGQGFYELLDEVYETGVAHVGHATPATFRVGSDGQEQTHFLDFVYEPLKSRNGEVNGIICIGFDVTETYRAHEALKALNADLERKVIERTLVRGRTWQLSPDLLGVFGPTGEIHASNPAWQTILGWSEAELASHTFFDFLHPDDIAESREIATLAWQGEPVTRFINRYRHKDGTYRHISWAALLEDDRVYGTGRDVTSEIEAARELSLTQEALRQAQKMEAVGQLTGGVAHDFNNMLAVVLGSLELLDRRLDPDDLRAKRHLGSALEAARRSVTLTQRLLAFSRQQPLQPEALSPNRLVSSMSDLFAHSLGALVKLETVLAAGVWDIFADQNQLENVLLNLAVNARDAMPEGGKLTIETQNAHIDERYASREFGVTPGQYLLIAVTDTGTGMPPEVLEKAFDPFFTTKEVGKGTGLGLSQVYGFVKQSGGHIKVYSEMGQGTTIKIYLPRYLGTGTTQLNEENSGGPLTADCQEVILVVDDEAIVRQFSVDALTDLGYQVIEAGSAAAALSILQHRQDVDLLFTDIIMPEMNGRRLADAARALRPNLPVIFTTGYTRNAVVHNGVVDAGVHLIGKPFTLEQLASKVREVLDTVSLRR